jgi:hypothetical protein
MAELPSAKSKQGRLAIPAAKRSGEMKMLSDSEINQVSGGLPLYLGMTMYSVALGTACEFMAGFSRGFVAAF